MTVPRSRPPVTTSLLPVRVVQASDRPDIGLTELGKVCEEDPLFRARLITHVNSASVGTGRRITSVQQAIALLGVGGVRSVALEACLSQVAPPSAGAGTDEDAVLLGLCLRRAVAARLCAQKQGRRDFNDCFVMGLLLDVGLIEQASEDMSSALGLARSPAAMRVPLAAAAGELDHPQRGARLAQAWQLEPEIVQAIARHHDRDPPGTPLGDLAWLVEHVAAVFEDGDPAAARDLALAAGVRVGLSVPEVDEVLAQLPRETLETAAQFRRRIDEKPELDALLTNPAASLSQVTRNYAELGLRLEMLLAEKGRLTQQLEQAQQQLKTLALSDALTGLPSARAFDELLARDLALADRQRSPLSIVLVDPDDLSLLGEKRRDATDHVLQACARIIRDMVRASDAAARVGAEQFGLILPNTELPGARLVAERLRKKVAQTMFPTPNGNQQLTVSLGVISTRGPGCRGTGQALLEAARGALQQAKRQGRNRTMVGTLE